MTVPRARSSSSTACRCRRWSPRRPDPQGRHRRDPRRRHHRDLFRLPRPPVELSLLRTGARSGIHRGRARPARLRQLRRPTPRRWPSPSSGSGSAYGAVDRILGERPRGAGLFLMGHSGGCELAMRMAAEERPSADLLGVELAGTGRHYHPAAREMLKTATREQPPVGPARAVVAPGRELYPPEVLTGVNGLSGGAALRGPDGVELGPPRPSRRSPPACASRCSSASPSTRRSGRPTSSALTEIAVAVLRRAPVHRQPNNPRPGTTSASVTPPRTTTRRSLSFCRRLRALAPAEADLEAG